METLELLKIAKKDYEKNILTFKNILKNTNEIVYDLICKEIKKTEQEAMLDVNESNKDGLQNAIDEINYLFEGFDKTDPTFKKTLLTVCFSKARTLMHILPTNKKVLKLTNKFENIKQILK